ncbi:MAG: nitroreductase/quinone reductase family protein [Pseudomonadales bacterium]
MKILKILITLAVVYVGIVVLFESLIGYFQPADTSTLVITTTDAEGRQNDRVLSAIDSEGKLYVAANHWPRAWYRAVRANPEVSITRNGTTGDYVAVEVTAAEHDKLDNEVQPLPFLVRFLTGFPPRYFVRLEPQAAS